MRVKTELIAWHGKEAIFSVDVQPNISGQPHRIATAGLDTNVRVWKLDNENKCFKFLSNLQRHDKAVNIVRFSSRGDLLASAGDDAVVIIWKLSEVEENIKFLDEVKNVETWAALKTLRGHLEDINDLRWSSDDSQLITGAVDRTAILWDVEKGTSLKVFSEAKHFVNGVTIDPLKHYAVTMSSDRAMRVYNLRKKKLFQTVTKMKPLDLNGTALKKSNGCDDNTAKETTTAEQGKTNKSEEKMMRMFHDETVVRRRLSFTHDGKVLVVPAGCVHFVDGDKKPTKTVNAVLLFSRHNFCKPFAYLPGLKDPPSLVAMCPVLFKNRKSKEENNLNLDYRYVFAVASTDDILLYDTETKKPFGFISNIHYSSITDLSWSYDASFLMVSSRDGFCSMIEFDENEIGVPYVAEKSPTKAEQATNQQDNDQQEETGAGSEERIGGEEDDERGGEENMDINNTIATEVSSESDEDEMMETDDIAPTSSAVQKDDNDAKEKKQYKKITAVPNPCLDATKAQEAVPLEGGSPAKVPRRITPIQVADNPTPAAASSSQLSNTPKKTPRRVNLITIAK